MKVVILAAGKGSRLGQDDHPKPLAQLDTGSSILELQLQALQRYVSLESVIVVVGYHKEEIMDRFPDLMYVYSPNFAAENTSKSLLRALRKCDEDVLWLNGDVVFHHSVLKPFLADRRTSMLVNIGEVGEEEVKYRQDINGHILEVSKHIDNPRGEALGINYCTVKDLDRLRRNLERCLPNDYFERALELGIKEGMTVWSVITEKHLCIEVDFPEDLVLANTLTATWKH